MKLPEKYYNYAKLMGWIKPECEIIRKTNTKIPCFPCECKEYYVRGNIAYSLVEKIPD